MPRTLWALAGEAPNDKMDDNMDSEAQDMALLRVIAKGDAVAPRQRQYRWIGGMIIGVALIAGTWMIRRKVERSSAAQEVTSLLEAVACGGEGQNCIKSTCCWDGGKHGLQCYAKDKFYAVCSSDLSCKKGVHPGEKHGTYDQYGKFHLDSWSCEELGERSRPACWSYNKTSCPSSRCMWLRDECRLKCSDMHTADACPDSHCIWSNSKCTADPCSAAGEDCSSTKCCSQQRGAAGMTCFKKDANYSACKEVCNPAQSKGWNCSALGKRTPIPAGCSWAGEDCAATKCCNNLGFTCAKKDDNHTLCVQTEKKTTWTSKKIPLPDGWEGTIVGGSRNEYEVKPSPDGKVAGTSFFCFMAVLPNSTEVKLMEVAKKHGQGIFACNASAIFKSWRSKDGDWDTGTATLVNTDVFIDVWDQVRKDGRYIHYDWTIKVDADCAFRPDRLRSHLWTLKPPPGMPLYIKNTNMDKGLSNGQFLGAIEIFSNKAVQTYFDNWEGCKKTLGLQCGEDGFFKGCMDALGVGYMHDGEVMNPDEAASACQKKQRAAFHPLKDPLVLDNCYNIIEGGKPDWAHNVATNMK